MHQVKLITVLGKILLMLPSDMELRIKTGTIGYNNKILVSYGNFSLGKNDECCGHTAIFLLHKLSKTSK